MKFPLDVESTIKNSGKMTVTQKATFTLFVAVFINVFIFAKLSLTCKSLGIPLFFLVLAQLIITGAIVIIFLRVFVIREQEKMDEYNNTKNTSLNRFWYLINKERTEYVDNAPLFEYSDGSYMIAMKFSYGSFKRTAADNTRDLFQYIFNEIARFNFNFQVIDMPERFEDTKEGSNFLGDIGKCKYDDVAIIYREICDNLLKTCSQYNTLVSTVFFIRILPVQVQDLKIFLTNVLEQYVKTESSIRNIEFLDDNVRSTIKLYMRDYYGLGALDLSNLHAHDIDDKTLLEYRDYVRICELELNTGEVKESKNRNNSKLPSPKSREIKL